jgi:hypothetical protein
MHAWVESHISEPQTVVDLVPVDVAVVVEVTPVVV